ncbi:MAG: MlaD family protein [Candidatus Brocadiia bacterium]
MGRKVLIGMLLLGGLIVFALATFYVENWQFYLGEGYRLTARFPVAQTLDEGDMVRLAGVPVGTVRDLSIDTRADTESPVKATLWIRSGVRVRAEDTAYIKMSTLFGGNYISIERGDPRARALADGESIPKTGVTPSITQVIEKSTETLTTVSDSFQGISEMVEQIREGKGALARLIQDEEFFNQLQGTVTEAEGAVAGLKKASERLEKGEGVLGKLLMDDQLASDLETITADVKELSADLRAISADLQDGQGTAGRLLKDEELYVRLRDAVDALAGVATGFQEGEGILPQLLQDEELATELRETAANLRDASERLATSEGTLGRLLSSDETYQKLNKSMDDLNQVTAALAEGEGTLGKIMMDDRLYNRITTIADDLQAMLDTYREQSPVISLAGAVFGAF